MVRRILLPLIVGLLGTGVLLALGQWQVQRLAWKTGILNQIETRIAAAPVPVPLSVDEARDKYLPVRASGTILPQEIAVLVSMKTRGPGYRIVSAFETDSRRLLLDRGFVPLDHKKRARPAVQATVIGNLHWPDDKTSSTPEPDLKAQIWFARDIPAMARALNTEPVLIIARQTDENPPIALPIPVDTTHIPNDHLGYAVTWFSLAAVWATMTIYFLWRNRRPTKG